jgi:glycosyltransferase involved in cell wall biosynthesis
MKGEKSGAPLISVLIPCFNSARFVGETIDTIKAQTWSNIEIIVVDDGSTDNSRAVITKHADHRVRLIEQANAGACAARNRAFSESRGDYVKFLDSDDLIDPDMVALQMARLEGQHRCVTSGEWGRFYDRPEDTRFEVEPVYRDLTPIDWLALSRAEGLGMMVPGLWLIPRPIVEKAGPWDVALTRSGCDDTEYFTRLLLRCDKVLFTPGARMRYRSGIRGSLSGSRRFDLKVKVLELCEAYLLAVEDSPRIRKGLSLSFQHIAHAAYPYDPALAERVLTHVRELHDVQIRPGGGRMFHIAARIFGWRIARRLQVASGRP